MTAESRREHDLHLVNTPNCYNQLFVAFRRLSSSSMPLMNVQKATAPEIAFSPRFESCQTYIYWLPHGTYPPSNVSSKGQHMWKFAQVMRILEDILKVEFRGRVGWYAMSKQIRL